MTITEYNTSERKNKHLNEFERGQIEALTKEGLSANVIAKRLGRSCSTITREMKRGSVEQIKHPEKKVSIYYADCGQRQYLKNRLACGRKFKFAVSSHLFLLAD